MKEFSYDIVYNPYQQKYIVFKTVGVFNFKGIYKSEKRKDCVNFLKKKLEEEKSGTK